MQHDTYIIQYIIYVYTYYVMYGIYCRVVGRVMMRFCNEIHEKVRLDISDNPVYIIYVVYVYTQIFYLLCFSGESRLIQNE